MDDRNEENLSINPNDSTGDTPPVVSPFVASGSEKNEPERKESIRDRTFVDFRSPRNREQAQAQTLPRFQTPPLETHEPKEEKKSPKTLISSPAATRFGMVPPMLIGQPVDNTGNKSDVTRFDGDSGRFSGPDEDGEEDYGNGQVLSHAVNKDKPTLNSLLYNAFFRIVRFVALLSVFLVLFGAGLYFFFYDSLYPPTSSPAPVQSDFTAKTPASSVRFFDLLASGHRFVYLVDNTVSMGNQPDSLQSLLARSGVQQSLSLLNSTNFFELIFFSNRISSIGSGQANPALVSAESSNIDGALEKMNKLHPEGTCNLEQVLLAAIGLKPDVLFLACDFSNSEQLSATVRDKIKTEATDMKFYVVEFGNTVKPINETSLQKLVQLVGGDYQWLNVEEKKNHTDELDTARREVYERTTVPSLYDMIEADFTETDIADVSTAESRKISPFGRDISTGSAESQRSVSGDVVSPLDEPPKNIALSSSVIREIEDNARIVYLSGFTTKPQNPQMLRVGAVSQLALWVRGAKAELPAAEYLLGLCYKNGVRVKMDELKAFQCEMKAAKQGCLPAMFLVADAYLARSEVDRNSLYTAKHWLEKAAHLGEPHSQCLWANRFTTKPEERFRWLEKAALQNMPDAQFLLGKCFETGNGISLDKENAIAWYEKSAKNGSTNAQMALEKLKTPEPPTK